jgi:hypothetical protein
MARGQAVNFLLYHHYKQRKNPAVQQLSLLYQHLLCFNLFEGLRDSSVRVLDSVTFITNHKVRTGIYQSFMYTWKKKKNITIFSILFFGCVLLQTNNVKVLWLLSSLTGRRRAQVPLLALFEAPTGT